MNGPSGRRLLVLITARGGSKGLPGKNLALVGGIPLVGRAARVGRLAAQALGPECRVVCSTDDPAIADAARSWGAEIPFLRPSELATDNAGTNDVVLHALDTLGGDFDGVILLPPTAPLTAVEDVLGSVAVHHEYGAPVVSVCAAEHPAEWLFSVDAAGRLQPMTEGEDVPYQRQKARVVYRLNGAVYVSDSASFRTHHTFFTPNTRGFVMPPERSIDIDTTLALDIARAVVAARTIGAVHIQGRAVGSGHPCFVIAEAGVNHNGSPERARELVDAAADAVKFQTFRAERLVTRTSPKAAYQVRATGEEESQFEMLKRLELDEAAHRDLIEQCRIRGILFLSTPFDEDSCDFLDSLGLPAFKLASGELTNVALLRHVAKKRKPLILSTGMASLEEVAKAVDAVRSDGNDDVLLLHCVSNYPAASSDVNLKAMATLREAFGAPVGFSDHTDGDAVALAAIAMGACVLEKHFTLDRNLAGPDHQASIEPAALTEMVRRIRAVEAALGHGRKEPAPSEAPIARIARRSLVAACDIPAGVVLKREMVAVRRPGTGLAPEHLETLLGRTVMMDIPEGAVLKNAMLS